MQTKTLSELALVLLSACGGATPPAEEPTGEVAETSAPKADDTATVAAAEAGAPVADTKPNPCNTYEIDLMNALSQSACEVPNPKPDAKSRELKGVLDVKVVPSAPYVAPGGHLDLTVIFTNKGKDPLPLDFAIDPLPRFVVEAYDAKGKRVDLPPGKEPSRNDSAPAASVSTARVVLATNGTAKVTVGWDAKKSRWAPEKVKGTPPEQGYPRVATGPLGSGMVSLRVVTPLLGMFEGMDKEVSAPKISVKVQ